MDHLPRPPRPTLYPLDVPYLCREFYDCGPFATYPQRQGWELQVESTTLTFKRNGLSADKDEINAFLQNWLYFGLLSETLGSFSPDI
jgi:hypothetical protein